MENPDRITYFAATDARGKRTPFGIKQKDRSKHMYVIGKTGMGKSTLLENMAIQDIRNGEGLAFIDPHGQTADKLLDYIPPERLNDVIYFAPFDLDYPIAFNVMEDVGYDKRHLVVSGLMATFKKIWVDAWSARMEYILSNTLLALLEYPDATLLGVNRMYTDKAYRKKVVENVKDPVVRDFWIKEFNTYTDRYTQEATPAIQNKIGQFTSNPLIRNIIGQPKSSFDIRELMDSKKILIINLSKGLVGETNMRLLGSMLTTRIFLGAMSRANLSEAQIAHLPNFFFYVDEFQNFANETFADILSEARKYKLNLVIANQYIKQLENKDDSTVKDAVFGNVGTTISFRVGPFDAEVLETVFAPEFTAEDLVNLGKAQIYITLMIDGVGSRPFSAITIPPILPPARTYRPEVLQASREHFASKRENIEQSILDELSLTATEYEEPAPAVKSYPRKDGTMSKPRAAGGTSSEKTLPSGTATPSHTLPAPHAAAARPAPKTQEQRAPRSESSSRNDRPQQQRVDTRTAPPPQKSAEDLRAILRTMAQKNPPQGAADKKENPLKDTLKKVVPAAPAAPAPLPEAPAPAPAAPAPSAPSAFEVPEEKLRALFKDV